MQCVYCEKSDCVYNHNEECSAREISIDEDGICYTYKNEEGL